MKFAQLNISPKYLLKRYSLIIFIVCYSTGLSAAILTLTEISTEYLDQNNPDKNITLTLDESTIEQLNKLKMSGQNNASSATPVGKTNPFQQ